MATKSKHIFTVFYNYNTNINNHKQKIEQYFEKGAQKAENCVETVQNCIKKCQEHHFSRTATSKLPKNVKSEQKPHMYPNF